LLLEIMAVLVTEWVVYEVLRRHPKKRHASSGGDGLREARRVERVLQGGTSVVLKRKRIAEGAYERDIGLLGDPYTRLQELNRPYDRNNT